MTSDARSGRAQRRPLRRRPTGSDDALTSLAARGDAGAFEALYEREHQRLYRYCRSIVRHDEDALDAVHEAMANAWDSLQRGEPSVPLRPWLFRIAHNEAINALRRRRPYVSLDECDAAATGGLEESLETRQRLATLQSDLAALPERQRIALVLRELSGLCHDEIAQVLEITPAVARQTIYEARLGLHEAEAGRQMECDAVRRALSDGDGRVRRTRKIRSHLRACASCLSFQQALRPRPEDVAALAPPVPGAAVGLLARLLGDHGASGGGLSGASGAMAPGG